MAALKGATELYSNPHMLKEGGILLDFYFQQKFGSCRVDLPYEQCRKMQRSQSSYIVWPAPILLSHRGRGSSWNSLSSLYQHYSVAAAGPAHPGTSLDCCQHSIPWKAASSRSGRSIGTGGEPSLSALALPLMATTVQRLFCSVLPAQHSD